MAEGIDRAIHHPRHVVVLRHVRLDGDGAAARRLDVANGGDIGLGAQAGTGDRRTLPGETQRRGAADAGARARDDGRLALKPHRAPHQAPH